MEPSGLAMTLRHANNLLFMKDFEKCICVCEHCLLDAQLHQDAEALDIKESLCIVIIQAYAELNRWNEVIPYISNIYKGIEQCPASVIKLIILLHARIRDFSTCAAVAHVWLRNPENFTQPCYVTVVESYLSGALQPQGRLADVESFVQSCKGLEVDQQTRFVERAQQIIEEESEARRVEVCRRDSSEDKKIMQEEGVLDRPVAFLASRCIRSLLQVWHKLSLTRISVLILVGLMCLSAVRYGKSNAKKRMSELMEFYRRIWTAMFAPYHLLKV